MSPNNLINLLIFLSLLTITTSKCTNSSDYNHLLKAFSSTTNFNTSLFDRFSTNCTTPITQINLSSRNLTGIISWNYLRNLTHLKTLDLSHNFLKGSVPNWVWTLSPLESINLSYNQFGGSFGISTLVNLLSLQRIDLSHNKFTKLGGFSGFFNLTFLDFSHNNLDVLNYGFFNNLTKLQYLDISNNNISGILNPIKKLPYLNYLDVSNNNLIGKFPNDFPPLQNLNFLNISFNKFTGNFSPKYIKKFGKSSFLKTGVFTASNVAVINKKIPSHKLNKSKKHKLINNNNSNKNKNKTLKNKKKLKLILAILLPSIGFLILLFSVIYVIFYRGKKINKGKKKWVISKPVQVPFKMDKSGPLEFETSSGTSWTVEIKDVTSASVVMFEKPLMSLTFKDLVGATCHFGRESQLAEGRCGPLYRAVLPGDLHVAIKVLENVRGVDRDEMVDLFESLGKFKHPNVLTISGYCIAGKEKLVLYEFMANGDLHSWLHELPPGRTNVDDWSTDTWEYPNDPEATPNNIITSPIKLNWLTRHRIALGVARGLAYLHHAQSKPMVHGHLVPSNILLTDDLEPRIADFGMCLEGDVGSVEDDVYGFGLVIIELMTGQSISSEEVLKQVRKSVRDGNGTKMLDNRLKLDDDSVTKAAVECLRVGFLCTAESASKRPTMQQVVGLLKDIRS